MSISENFQNNIYCCDEILKTAFCPKCGRSAEDAELENESPFPYRFKVYLHDDEKQYDIAEKLGFNEDNKLWPLIVGCAVEVELEFEITAKDGEVNLLTIDGEPVVKPKFEVGDLVDTDIGICVIKEVTEDIIVTENHRFLRHQILQHFKPIGITPNK